MAKIKKAFDRDSMYKKIMPTNLKKEIEQINVIDEKDIDIVENKIPNEVSIFQNKELNLIKEEKNEVILYNVTEKLVLKKLDATLKKMNCCRCDRCKEDIIAISLNNLKPMYIVATKDEIKQKVHELSEMSSEVTTEVIKAVLTVRKNPRH
ncbi:MAG: competence protein ComFB [Sedimentibacter sp.]|jgi:hypothetical protein|nr:competence protein ComFB [Sedimentibacter sp.]